MYYEDYILDTFRSIYEVNSEITIGYNSSCDVCILNSSDTFFNNTEAHPENFTFKKWDNRLLPVLFSKDNIDDWFTLNRNQVIINYDILGAAFYFISGWQEIHTRKRDEHGRFPYNESHQKKYDYLTVPVVNYYFDVLKKAIELSSNKHIQRKIWPDSNFKTIITHDIDKINSGWKEGGFSALKKGNFITLLSLLAKKVVSIDPWQNIPDIVELERSLNIPSTFFFLTSKEKGNADYKLTQVKPWLDLIIKQGSEVALHGSLGSCNNHEVLKTEKSKLITNPTGNRFHYLKFEPSTFAKNLEYAGFKYDSSVGFAEHIGFRYGFCFPFKLYDLQSKSVSDVLEIPLVLMDATLSHQKYMKNDPEKHLKIDLVIEEVKKFGGVLRILWHNNYFSEHKYSGWKELFISIIKKLIDKGSCFSTCNEIADQFNLDE